MLSRRVIATRCYCRSSMRDLPSKAGATQGWHRYVGDRGDVLGVDRFGASAPGDVVMREYGFTIENVCKRTLALLS